jgi:acyl carrier protein
MSTDSLAMRTVQSAVARHLDLAPEDVGGDVDLREGLGLDPLDLVLIVTRVEEELAIEISLPRLDYVRSVQDLASLIEDEEEPPTLRDPGIGGPGEEAAHR